MYFLLSLFYSTPGIRGGAVVRCFCLIVASLALILRLGEFTCFPSVRRGSFQRRMKKGRLDLESVVLMLLTICDAFLFLQYLTQASSVDSQWSSSSCLFFSPPWSRWKPLVATFVPSALPDCYFLQINTCFFFLQHMKF